MHGKRTFTDLPVVRMLPAAWLMATIWWLSDRSGYPKPPGFTMEFWSIVAHLGLYALLGLFVWWALGMNSRLLNIERTWYAIGIATAYGVLDEIHQHFVPERHFSILDMVVNFIGAALAVFIIPKIINKYTI